MSELTCLKLSILLWVVHVATQAAFAGGSVGVDFLGSTRDKRPEPQGVKYPRATRALANYLENFLPFLAADLGLIVTNQTGGWGATIWILARIAYLPLYVMGVTPWRSIAWAVGVVGLVMMWLRLVF